VGNSRFLNARRHRGARRQPQPRWVDPCSSACWFDGWRVPLGDALDGEGQANPLPRPLLWLLRNGWRRGRGGLIATDEVPGRGCRTPRR